MSFASTIEPEGSTSPSSIAAIHLMTGNARSTVARS
jgi:hypothetical protein